VWAPLSLAAVRAFLLGRFAVQHCHRSHDGKQSGKRAWSDIDTSRAVIFPGFFEQQNASYDADTGQVLPMARTLLACGALSPAASAKETRRCFSSFQSTSRTDLRL